MKLFPAKNLADRIAAELAPLCDKIEIAGSIRRARETVNDIDLVILPKPGQLDAIKARCKQRCRVITDGRQNFIVELDHGSVSRREPFQLDIFFARPPTRDLLEPIPGNWGTLLVCRTGSMQHNIHLCQAAKAQDKKWNPYEGIFAGGQWTEADEYIGGKLIASETEEEIFAALGMKCIAPVCRERP